MLDLQHVLRRKENKPSMLCVQIKPVHVKDFNNYFKHSMLLRVFGFLTKWHLSLVLFWCLHVIQGFPAGMYGVNTESHHQSATLFFSSICHWRALCPPHKFLCVSVCIYIYAYTFLHNQNMNDMKVVELVQLDLMTLAILDYKLWKGIQAPSM